MGWTALIFAIVLFAMTFLSQYFMEDNVEVAMIERVKEHGLMVAKMKNPELVESMGMIGPLFRQWMKRHTKILHLSDNAAKTSAYLASANGFVRSAQGALVLCIGAWLVAIDELRPAAMVASNLLVMRGVAPIDMIVGAWEQWVIAKKSFKRLTTLLRNNPVLEPKEIALPPAGHMVCEDLFAFADAHEGPILKGINLSFIPGKVTAILGPSGSGKSTLSRCLLGIWPQIEGRVSLDGHDILGYDREKLGPYIGYLPQDIELFAGNVADNIARFGDVEMSAVVEAAELVGLHHAILGLPWGYDTPISHAKGFLSGGQRQRLGLARAIFRNPKVILLDEPNSNLDHEGEQFLFRAINSLKEKGATIFVVAHTPSILAVVDYIVTLKDGKVEAYGPKEAVLGWSTDVKAN